jgi:hypothetical protein
MKTLKKILAMASTVAVLSVAGHVNAQTTPAGAFRFSVGVDAGIPTGNLTIGSNFVLGGTIRGHYGLSNNFALTLTSGADHFFSKINPATGKKFDSFGIIPVKAGFKEFVVPNIYVAAEAGAAVEETDTGAGNTKFLVSPSVGWANTHWDIGVRYDNYTGQADPYGFVALRLAYGFGL